MSSNSNPPTASTTSNPTTTTETTTSDPVTTTPKATSDPVETNPSTVSNPSSSSSSVPASTDQPTSPDREKWEGSCHCGAQSFTVTLDSPLYASTVNNCNCSICAIHGYLFVYPKDEDIVWNSGGPESGSAADTSLRSGTPLRSYSFNKGVIVHSFCPVCGTSMCGKSTKEDFFGDQIAINVRTFKGVELEKLQIKQLDGKNYTM